MEVMMGGEEVPEEQGLGLAIEGETERLHSCLQFAFVILLNLFIR